MNKPNNPPAFPTSTACDEGMTLRDYFAAKAMQGELASQGQEQWNNVERLSSRAYRIADAMLAEREKNA